MVSGCSPGSQHSDTDHFHDPQLPRDTPVRSINTLLKCKFGNDCEVIARKRFREVDAALSWLLEYAPSRLTGTGCVFAEFDTESAARQVLESPGMVRFEGFVARGVNIFRSKAGAALSSAETIANLWRKRRETELR